MRDDIAISVKGVSKDFVLPHKRTNSLKGMFTSLYQKDESGKDEVQHALKDINFEIKKGEFFGIVGRNGSGKSTLLKILAGIYQPTTGSVQHRGKLVPFIELGVGFNPELTGRENVYLNGAMLGFTEKKIDEMYDDIVDFAELERFMDQKLKNYSSGMQVRLAFSMATRAEADVLLVDEVLAVGDADFQRKCFDYFRTLKKNKKTVIFVSHDMSAVREYCSRAVLIEDSKLVLADNASRVATAYTKMFIEQTIVEGQSKTSKRWGDGVASFDKITLDKTKLMSKDQTLTITTSAVIKKDIKSPVLGFSVKNASDLQLLGTNNQIKQQVLPDLAAGDCVSFVWKIPNIFNDGRHFVDVAIVHQDGSQVADWWEEAATFTVVQEEKTPYVTSPNIDLKIAHGKAGKK